MCTCAKIDKYKHHIPLTSMSTNLDQGMVGSKQSSNKRNQRMGKGNVLQLNNIRDLNISLISQQLSEAMGEPSSGKILNGPGSCHDAFDLKVKADKIRYALRRRPPLLKMTSAIDGIMLQSVNFGSGTTGTHAVHDAIVRMYPHLNVHHYHEKFVHILRIMRRCVGYKEDLSVISVGSPVNKANCESNYILNILGEATVSVLKDSVFLSDSPVSWLFPDLFTLIPEMTTISTFRDIESFMKSRIKHHRDDFICHPSLWKNSAILHPFDIVACLRLKATVPEALQYVNDVYKHRSMKQDIKMAYKTQNSVNSMIASSNGKFLPLCVQDIERKDSTSIIVRAASAHFNKTNTLWGKEYSDWRMGLHRTNTGARRLQEGPWNNASVGESPLRSNQEDSLIATKYEFDMVEGYILPYTEASLYICVALIVCCAISISFRKNRIYLKNSRRVVPLSLPYTKTLKTGSGIM